VDEAYFANLPYTRIQEILEDRKSVV